MTPTCHYVMPSGLRCQSPAMRGYAFCYHHARRAKIPAEMHIETPCTLDGRGIAQTVHQILNALGSNRISPRRASVLLDALKMAASSESIGSAPSEISLAQIEPTRQQKRVDAGRETNRDIKAVVDSMAAQNPRDSSTSALYDTNT